VPEADLATRAWRGIDQLAELIGAYCWVENRIFEIGGAWATASDDGPGAGLDPALRVWCAATSRRHGLLALRWAERLPVRAGIDRTTLVAAPDGPLARGLDTLAVVTDPRDGVAAMVATVLPRLREVYGAHRQTASPVSEASVLEVLTGADREMAAEIGGGEALLQGSAGGVRDDNPLGGELERAFAQTAVFPAVPAS
jgi:hypothetical protein